MQTSNRLLIVGPSWVGDMIMAQTLFKFLRAKQPDREIDVLAPASSLPLVTRMPEVSQGIAFKLTHGELRLGYRRGFGEHLRERNYRQAFVLPNSFKSALVPFFADIPLRTGFRGEYRYVLINDMRMLSRDRLPRMVDRFLALGVPVGSDLPTLVHPRLMVDEANRGLCLERCGLSLSRPVLALCPGAEFGDAKKWPERHFGDLAAHAVSRGMQVWIMGGPADRPTGEAILEALPAPARNDCHDLTGKTSLLDAIDLLSAARLVVTNDSGLMHVACALDLDVAVIYGSTSPGFTPPLNDRAAIFSEALNCSPCFKRVCPLGHKNCLVQLLPARLNDWLDQAMRAQSG